MYHCDICNTDMKKYSKKRHEKSWKHEINSIPYKGRELIAYVDEIQAENRRLKQEFKNALKRKIPENVYNIVEPCLFTDKLPININEDDVPVHLEEEEEE